LPGPERPVRIGWATVSIGDISLNQAELVERIDFRFAEPLISGFAIRFRSGACSCLHVFAPTVRLMTEVPDTRSIDRLILALYCEPRNIQEARLLITIFRLICAVLAVLSSSLKFLSLRTGAVVFVSGNSHGYRYC
jgi:hypothetical protein